MAKRFAADDIWLKRWYRRLPPLKKLAVKYLYDRCDRAGFWPIDLERMAFDFGVDDLPADILNGIKDVEIVDGEAHVVDFIEFQYGTLNPANKAHVGIIAILEKKLLPRGKEGPCKGLGRGLEGA